MESAPLKLRGELTKWLMETKPGVFVGNVNAAVRERLWKKVTEIEGLSGLIIYNMNNEQGFDIMMCGDPKRSVIDLEGIKLIKMD